MRDEGNRIMYIIKEKARKGIGENAREEKRGQRLDEKRENRSWNTRERGKGGKRIGVVIGEDCSRDLCISCVSIHRNIHASSLDDRKSLVHGVRKVKGHIIAAIIKRAKY